MRKLPTKANVDDYIDNAASCPFCDEQNIIGTYSNFDFIYAYREVECQDCGKQWREEYNLVGISVRCDDGDTWYSDEAAVVQNKITGRGYYTHEPEAQKLIKNNIAK